jgi:hypothetical protein
MNAQSIEKIHAARHAGITLEELAKVLLETIWAMDNDQRAHLRAKLHSRLGFSPNSSDGKPP